MLGLVTITYGNSCDVSRGHDLPLHPSSLCRVFCVIAVRVVEPRVVFFRRICPTFPLGARSSELIEHILGCTPDDGLQEGAILDMTSTTPFDSDFASKALSPESRHPSGFLGLDPLPLPLHGFVPCLLSHTLKFLSQSFLLHFAPFQEVRLRLLA
jgi:hypothetical protein